MLGPRLVAKLESQYYGVSSLLSGRRRSGRLQRATEIAYGQNYGHANDVSANWAWWHSQ